MSTAALVVHIDYVPSRTVTAIMADPPAPGLWDLIGKTASSGFRRAVEQVVPGAQAAHPLRFQLLDDLPTVLLVSGYAIGAGGARFPRPAPTTPGPVPLPNVDLCAGWASGGTILTEFAEHGEPPVVTGPSAPDLRREDDPLALHRFGPLPAHGMRRLRRLDLWPQGDLVAIDCFFRDSHFDPGGVETVIHEYTITASLDPATMRFVSCEASVGALPWVECPAAAASAGRLVGVEAAGLRSWVRDNFVGTTTCTHLNDTLRSLADVDVLVSALPER
jgi:hypothetical protein